MVTTLQLTQTLNCYDDISHTYEKKAVKKINAMRHPNSKSDRFGA